MKFLIIEDNTKLRRNIVSYLEFKKYSCDEVFNGQEALEKLENNSYDAIVLDINMPGMNGKEFLQVFRKTGKNIPIIALTSNHLLEDKVEVFELGVSDYLVKPFELLELEMRLQVLARKNTTQDMSHILSYKDIFLDTRKHTISKNNQVIICTRKEYEIFEYLVLNRGIPKNKVQIMEKVWGEEEENLDIASTTFEVHISHLRKKLGRDIIKTLRGVGYIVE